MLDKVLPYGLTRQFSQKTVTYILYLVGLFFAALFLGHTVIDHWFPSSIYPDANHYIKDAFIIVDLVCCFFCYIYWMIQFMKQQQKYISYLIESIHEMKSGCFKNPVKVEGNNELSHLAGHIDELRKIIGMYREKEDRRKETQIALLTSISHDLRTPLDNTNRLFGNPAGQRLH